MEMQKQLPCSLRIVTGVTRARAAPAVRRLREIKPKPVQALPVEKEAVEAYSCQGEGSCLHTGAADKGIIATKEHKPTECMATHNKVVPASLKNRKRKVANTSKGRGKPTSSREGRPPTGTPKEAECVSVHVKEEPDTWEQVIVTDTDIYPLAESMQTDPTHIKTESPSCKEKHTGDTELTEQMHMECTSVHIKEESDSWEEVIVPGTDVEGPADSAHVECTSVHIKEDSEDGGSDLDTSTEDPQTAHPSASIKEESDSWKELTVTEDYITTRIKDESDSSEDENLTDTDDHTPGDGSQAEDQSCHSKEESGSCEEDADLPTHGGVLTCNECGKRFKRKFAYMSHQKKHAVERMFNCHNCQKFFVADSEKQPTTTNKIKFTCSVCSVVCTRKTNLISHYKTHLEKEIVPCDNCKKTCSGKYNLLTHRKIEVPVPCSECGKFFSNPARLSAHQMMHTEEKPFSCSTCGKCFRTHFSLVRHNLNHVRVKRFLCLVCGKLFLYKSKLIEHNMSHTGDKPFSCPECGKRFSTNSDLIKHERVHTGEKPFSCTECGKCFKQKSILVSHRRSHTGEKPYACSQCDKRYASKYSLRNHEKGHPGEKPSQVLNVLLVNPVVLT
uniref:C2H2-type domain-containing protein n=1 Tax=Leptobrachium leishanense TaxID=445787 RepID=A0A8C5WD23_9ANUR